MPRPEIELYSERAKGLYGQAWVHNMEHCGMLELLAYVIELEQTQCKCKEQK